MSTRPVVYVIGGAAPPIFDIEEPLLLLQQRGWRPCLILTSTAANWIDASHFGKLAGCPVRVEPRLPGEKESLPMADAVLAAPLTFNTTNKWAAGINDTLALGILNELLGENVPIIATPCVKAVLRRNPAYIRSCKLLEDCAVTFLDPERATVRKQGHVTFDWTLVLDKFDSISGRKYLRQ